MTRTIFAIALGMCLFILSAAGQRKPCEELKAEIAAKLDAKGIKNYSLNIVEKADVKDQVVGTCDGGTKSITYTRKQ